jgi:microcystin degradation protein MlrC
MRSFVDRIKSLEGRDGILSVSIAHGFSHADVADMGTRVLVVSDNRKQAGDDLARELGEELRESRGNWAKPALSLEESVSRVLDNNEGTAILAEAADNAGGGAASDNTLVIHELRRRGARSVAIAPVWDAQAVSFCHMAGLGARLPLRFGGKASAGSGPPVDADVEVIGLANDAWQYFGAARVPLGDTAAIRVDGDGEGGIDVILISSRTQAFSTELFTQLGLDPAAYRVLVLKSAQHFAGAFGPLASLIVRGETGGCCPTDPRRHDYTRLARPIWPLDPLPEGRALI